MQSIPSTRSPMLMKDLKKRAFGNLMVNPQTVARNCEGQGLSF